jgi:hypothetical protein
MSNGRLKWQYSAHLFPFFVANLAMPWALKMSFHTLENRHAKLNNIVIGYKSPLKKTLIAVEFRTFFAFLHGIWEFGIADLGMSVHWPAPKCADTHAEPGWYLFLWLCEEG